jgi:probable lipoprotein NlpC
MKLDGIRVNITLTVYAGLLVGCGTLQEKNPGSYVSAFEQRGAASQASKQALYDHYYEWRGVRYKLGGLSKQGIDCSGFVYVAYKSKLGINLPRTTKLQSELGKKVSKKDLKTGDLVFFKTGKITRHVGIYLEENMFLHASASKGVMISRLDNVYWKSNYWKSIRI